jgi:hypothetical protein
VICAGSAFLAAGVAIIRHGLKNLSEGRSIPSEISRLEESIAADSGRALKATLDGFTASASALESARVNLENKVEGLKRQRATRDEEIKRLKIEEGKAEEEKKKNELNWGDALELQLTWVLGPLPIPLPGRAVGQKLYGKAVSKLKEISESLAKAKQAYASLCEQIDYVATQGRVIESQLTVLKTQSESALKNAERQLKELLNADPRLVQFRAKKASADGLGRVLQLLHLLTGSLCILMACRTALRAMQLAGRLAPHTLVREVRSNG